MSETPQQGYSDRSAVKADAYWAAQAAIEALQNGRYALGATLARTAYLAEREALRMPPGVLSPALVDDVAKLRRVPFLGSTREEHPARPDGSGPTGDGDGDLAATAIFDATQTHLRPVPPVDDPRAGYQVENGRCRWMGPQDPPGSECWSVIYLDPHHGWVHMDRELDKAHPASPSAPGTAL